MAYAIEAGIQLSLDGKQWYSLTDHNRSEIQNNPMLIEKDQRMADGSMRKFVIAKKNVISTAWEFVPSASEQTVDGNASAAWLSSFYNANVFVPIYVKVVNAKLVDPGVGNYPSDTTHMTSKNGYDIYKCFITKFSNTVVKRTTAGDFLNMDIEFTEI